MKKNEIEKGKLYTARVGSRVVIVRVDDIRDAYPGRGTRYDVTNLTTKRTTTFRSAQKFRRRADRARLERAIMLGMVTRQEVEEGL